MSSRPTEPRSIARQLVTWFALGAARLLFCALAVLYWIVVQHAFEEDNEVLRDRVFGLRADLERSGGPAGLNEELHMLRRGERVVYLARVIDAAGQVVAETPGMNRSLPASVFPAPEAEAAAQWTPRDIRAEGKLFSLVAVVQEAAGQRFVIQVAQDRSADDRFMREFAILVAGVLAIGIIGAAAIAITVTRRGLRPLGRMMESMQHIGPHQLDERLGGMPWPRELRPLATSFDEMLDRLEDSFTRLTQFSADLAHELRTPVANIRGESEVALTRSRTAEEYREVIESTVAECERLAGIIDSLLFLARAEAPQREVMRLEFDGREAVEKIVSYYGAIAEERQVNISCSGDGTVHADPLLFTRAVTNLVNNALRFTPDGGTIKVTLQASAEAAIVSVSDTGVGIPAEHLPRVFDRFYQADPSRSSVGSGLGLALVKSIVELHRGSATIDSKVDRGTTVTLVWPHSVRVRRSEVAAGAAETSPQNSTDTPA